MKSSDKFQIGIVVGIILLVVVAFTPTLNREEPDYMAEDTADGVAFNYLLAILKEEYERAYGYLSPGLLRYPANVETFASDIGDQPWSFSSIGNVTLVVRAAAVTGNSATVKVYETTSYYTGLSLGQTVSKQANLAFEMILELMDGVWKITDSDYHFASCWAHTYTYCR